MASLDDLPPRNISGSNPTASQSAAQNLTPKDSISEAGITPIKDPAQSQEGANLQDKGIIIVLTGIVAAGKSSIVKAVRSIDPEYKEEDLDDRRDPQKPTTPEMELKMIDDVIDRSLEGKKTIVSLLKADSLSQRMLERNISALPVKTLLAHCPFSEIPIRLGARNRAAQEPGGDPNNYRDPFAPLLQFASLYMNNKEGIEEIDRAQAIKFFDSSFDEMVERTRQRGDPLPQDEELAKEKSNDRDLFLMQLGFTDESQAKVNVAPKDSYDIVIDTSKYRDEASRKEVIGKILRDIKEGH